MTFKKATLTDTRRNNMKALFSYLATAVLASAVVTAAAPVRKPASGERETTLPYYPPYYSNLSYPLIGGIYPIMPPVGPNASVFNSMKTPSMIEPAAEPLSQSNSNFRNEH